MLNKAIIGKKKLISFWEYYKVTNNLRQIIIPTIEIERASPTPSRDLYYQSFKQDVSSLA